MLILDIIFDYVLFLSKKEIYKERKFSFLSYQNLRFWGKMIRAELAQLIILDKMHSSSFAFVSFYSEFGQKSSISTNFTKRDEVSRRKALLFVEIKTRYAHFFEIQGILRENASFSRPLTKFFDFVEKCLHFEKKRQFLSMGTVRCPEIVEIRLLGSREKREISVNLANFFLWAP